MKVPLTQAEPAIPSVLAEGWQLDVTALEFLPLGNSAYCYRVATSGEQYLLKLVSLGTLKGQATEQAMRYSLPLTWHLFQSGAFRRLAPALPTVEGRFSMQRSTLLFALYPFLEGTSLADAYPLSDALVEEIAGLVADLHQVKVSGMPVLLPQEQFTLPFLPALLQGVASLELLAAHAPLYQQRLRDLVWPRHEYIEAFIERLLQAQARVQQQEGLAVLCHGDVWGGNLIRSTQQGLCLVDWESAIVAPPERDAFGFVRQLAAFTAGYQYHGKTDLRWNRDLLTFFACRQQVRNLWQWMHNLLYEETDPLQCENDLEMIDFHCLQRWDALEATLRGLPV